MKCTVLKDQIADMQKISPDSVQKTKFFKTLWSLIVITTAQHYVLVIQYIILPHPLRLLLTRCPTEGPPNILFHLPGCSPSSTPEVIQEIIEFLQQILHSDKIQSAAPPVNKYVSIKHSMSQY